MKTDDIVEQMLKEAKEFEEAFFVTEAEGILNITVARKLREYAYILKARVDT